MAPALTSSKPQPRKVRSVPEVSLSPNTAPVAEISWLPNRWLTVASAPATFTSSPTQELMAEGVIVSATSQVAPSCSWEIGG